MTAADLVEPAYRTSPDWYDTAGGEVADLAELAGFAPDPEQRLGLDMLFAVDRYGKSAAFEFAVICSRQNLKTGLFKQAALGWLFLTDQRLIVWSAHEFPTAREAFRDMVTLITTNPFLHRRVKDIYYGSGNESIELLSGARLIFRARTGGGGRGLSGDKVVLDEAYAVRPAHMGALLPTLSARPDPQVVYGSSAGLPSSDVLRGVRDRGRAGTSARLAYLEWCARQGGCQRERCDHAVGTPGCALDQVENLRAANPLLGRTRANGTGLTLEYLRAERDALTPDEFARERLGWWDEAGAAEVFGPRRWEACAAPYPRPKPLVLAVAVSIDQSWASIVAAGLDGDRVVVRPAEHRPGLAWLVDRVAELRKQHQVLVVIDGRGPAAQVIPDLQARGVRCHVMTTGEVLDACAQLYTLVFEARLSHDNYSELNEAVSGATTRAVGDRWAWGRRTSTTDISPLEAATFAAWWVSRPKPALPPPLLPEATPAAAPGEQHHLATVGF